MKAKNLLFLLAMISAFLLISNCNKDEEPTQEETNIQSINQDAPFDVYSAAVQLLKLAGWSQENDVDIDPVDFQLMNFSKEDLGNNIMHYYFEVSVGADDNDKIGLHRVVKQSNNQPLKTEKTFFFQHGDLKNFIGMMLPANYSPSTPNDFGLGIYLAENNVDVWGMDQAWCMADETTTDFSYMQGYGLGKSSGDLRTGMAIARIARYLVGNTLDKMTLACYSSGVSTGFALLNHEAQLDNSVRHTKSYVPIDLPVISDDAPLNLFMAGDRQTYVDAIAGGNYESPLFFTLVAELARTDPNGDSPVFEGFTNNMVALFFGSGPIAGDDVIFHYLAGNWVDGFPASFKYVTMDQWLDFMASGVDYQPCQFFIDLDELLLHEVDSPFDDNFSQITIPIYNLSCAGGFGELTKYAFNKIGSTDVTHHIPALDTPENALFDFGHIDIFLGNNAETIIWEPLLNWLNAH
jgi:hypothetical protein